MEAVQQVQQITISAAWGYFLGACVAIVSIAKAWDIVKHWGKGDITEKIKGIEQKLDNDKKRIDKLEESTALNMQAMFALINHSIDGNNVENMKKIRDKIAEHWSCN